MRGYKNDSTRSRELIANGAVLEPKTTKAIMVNFLIASFLNNAASAAMTWIMLQCVIAITSQPPKIITEAFLQAVVSQGESRSNQYGQLDIFGLHGGDGGTKKEGVEQGEKEGADKVEEKPDSSPKKVSNLGST